MNNLLNQTVPITARQFGWFRIALGAYLAIHFGQLLPWAGELFGGNGVLADPSANLLPKILPSPLWNTPGDGIARACVFTGMVAGIAIAIGRARRFWCFAGWLIWAWLFGRNNLILNPGMPYVGLVLLMGAIIPTGEALVVGRREDPAWRFPALAWWTVWLLLAAGYSFSGVMKLSSPSWIDGSALRVVMENPLARDSWLRELFLALPVSITNLMTWGSLALEILFLPLALIKPTRFPVWAGMVAMHLGILVLIDFADLTLGMLLAHAFTWRPEWFTTFRHSQNTIEIAPDPHTLSV